MHINRDLSCLYDRRFEVKVYSAILRSHWVKSLASVSPKHWTKIFVPDGLPLYIWIYPRFLCTSPLEQIGKSGENATHENRDSNERIKLFVFFLFHIFIFLRLMIDNLTRMSPQELGTKIGIIRLISEVCIAITKRNREIIMQEFRYQRT